MEDINEKFLYKEIEFDGKSEEFNELAKNFNSMMLRLQKAFQSQKQFVQNVSHEIKTPLTIIRANLEVLLMDTTTTKDELDKSLKTSIESIDNLNKLAEDLLILSQLDNKKVEQSKIDLHKMIESLVTDLSKISAAKDIQINFEGHSSRFVNYNEGLLKRAISNIIENSIKYSPKKSKISVVIFDEGYFTKIKITDEGNGIPEDQLKKVFERFFRSEDSRSRETGGAGIGLSITKEIIDSLNGEIFFKNLNPGLEALIKLPTYRK